ncbi:SDR family oxidoreductase [Flavisphingomonas formosensis]|uniref:SDR family oxidoreductase n=1 Tax=Flavisphingomonas formosensis TaxID=861534 RepID=UPI0012F7CAF5|nr:SDR family NAD(P)-dependent oxidoreductase [Sphingomonas formosensis]
MITAAPDITDKVYIVTGTSRGVGVEIARTLHRRGARIGMLARTLADLEENAREFGDRALALPCDVADRAVAQAAVTRIAEHFGGIDGLVNNAGLSRIAPVERLSEEDLLLMFRVNVIGVVNMVQAVLPHLRARGGGNILNISSSSVRDPSEFPFLGGYAASKAALERLTQELRIEVSRDNIAVTLFSLGSTLTHFGTGWAPEITEEAFAEWDRRGGAAPATMDPSLPAEAVVRCLESPPGACANFIEFQPYAAMEKGRRMAD